MMSHKALFNKGIDANTYLHQGSDEEIESVITHTNYLGSRLPQSICERLSSIKKEVHILICAEMWCPDCQINVTAISYISELQPKIKISIISKVCAEEHLMETLPGNNIKIPLMLILDSEYLLNGLFVERPITVLLADSFEKVKDDYFAGEYLHDTIGEILDVIELIITT
jgi:hypothetical protein